MRSDFLYQLARSLMGAELEPPIFHYVNGTFLIIDFHADCEYVHSYKPLDCAEF